VSRLTPEQLRSKLVFDSKLMRSLASRHFGPVRPYASALDARARRELTPEAERAGHATVYDVTYRFPIKVSRTATTESATARFDLLAGGNFPMTAPLVCFVSQPVPWSPHVDPSGVVCIGKGWNSRLTAHLAIHVMRLVNFHEPPPADGYAGYNAEAIAWWKTVLGYRPLYPDLEYPVVPAALTHGSEPQGASFRIVGEGPVFPIEDMGRVREQASSGFTVIEE
jgi:hypothetical protein